jgi:hypothetical protein
MSKVTLCKRRDELPETWTIWWYMMHILAHVYRLVVIESMRRVSCKQGFTF